MKKRSANIPIYDISRFTRKGNASYQVEVFDKNRNFNVDYPHRHDDFFEILFITQGKGNYTIDFREYNIEANTVFFLSPGQIHEIRFSDDIQGYIFLFTSEFYLFNKPDRNKLFELPFFYPVTEEAPPLKLKKEKEQQLLTDLFRRAMEESENAGEDHIEALQALLDLLLITCKRLYSGPQEEGLKKGSLLVKRFKQLIEERCTGNLSVKDYAQVLSVTPSHLSETVKSITGRTSSDLINDRMLLEMKRLLIHTELGISEIAYKLNFADQSYFSKYFKKLTGKAPGDFRVESRR